MTWPRAALTAGVYVVAALVLTWPLAQDCAGQLAASQGPGIPFQNLWILGWGLHAWTHDPVGVLTGRVFDANIFFPAPSTLAYSDHLLLPALVLSPVYALSAKPTLCYNLLLLLSIAGSGWAMHSLVRALTGSAPAALVVGIAWACWPYRTAHFEHIQLQALYFMPVTLLFLHRVVARRRWRDTVGLGMVTGLQVVASFDSGVIGGVLLAVSSVALAVSTGQWRSVRLWSRLLVAAALALVVVLPTLVPYVRAQATGSVAEANDARTLPASWRSYTQVPPQNWLYGRTGLLAPRVARPGERDRRGADHLMFPGLVLIGLAGIGLVGGWRGDSRPLVTSAFALLSAGLVLSLLPGNLLAFNTAGVGGLSDLQIRWAPPRFGVVAFMGLALLAAIGVRVAVARAGAGLRERAQRIRRGKGLALLFVVAMAAEYVNGPVPLVATPPRQTAVGQWLAAEPLHGAVLHLPLAADAAATAVMVQSLEHRRPIVNGYGRRQPAFFDGLAESLADFPSRDSLAALRKLDTRFVVVASTIAGAGNARLPLVERARFDDAVIYEVRWTSEAIEALGDQSGPPPPSPGDALFFAGETATYDIYWDGGPFDVVAGAVVLKVLEGSPPAAPWRFEAQADTANWVATFYKARNRYTTTADVALLPLEHSREIREGNDHLERTYVYDRSAQHVRVGDTRDEALAVDALTLPLENAAARDFLTALYFVRTLPLSAGSIVSVPINEAGANIDLQVAVAEPETIAHRGQSTPVVRLEPRMTRRLEGGRPVAMTLWLSADGRVPLRAVIQAGFGRIRAELRDYQLPDAR